VQRRVEPPDNVVRCAAEALLHLRRHERGKGHVRHYIATGFMFDIRAFSLHHEHLTAFPNNYTNNLTVAQMSVMSVGEIALFQNSREVKKKTKGQNNGTLSVED
jgi:hypothetical protein